MTEPLDLSSGSPVFKSLMDNSQDLFTLVDDTGLILYQNRSVQWRLGLEPDNFIGKNIFEFLHPDDVEKAITSLGNIGNRENIDRIIVRLRNHQGEWRDLEVLGWPQEIEGQK
ncbi:MAG: PAS domain S-box protein [Pseudomonadales bacterium]|jgi:PAS domain S-box-containing protein|nr:PAS domain S-box protein [Pseudomonadales bacterium]